MRKAEALAELRGIAKILDCLWENSYYSMGKLASERIKKEMVYFFGENWTTDMYEFIATKEIPSCCHPEFPEPLKKYLTKGK